MGSSPDKMDANDQITRAMKVIDALVDSLNTPYEGSSSLTTSIYDTAWVAMVTKEITYEYGDKRRQWIFPDCFHFLLCSQREDGGFGANASEVDGILNTMAAVLALCRYSAKSAADETPPAVKDLKARIERGTAYLNKALAQWNVHATVHVGFEILIPKLLELLQKEGIEFEFEGRSALLALNRRKLEGIKPSVLYTPRKTTLLHSLEAFVGQVDMDRLRHHLVKGSMMGSPSSTAAYLMNLTEWDDEAEEYLRFVVRSRKGGVPSAFPISIFETSWVLTTFLEAGLGPDELGSVNLSKLGDFLESNLQLNGGVMGFAPGCLADGDDTAKSILSLRLLGRDVQCDDMVKLFETNGRFKTYELESSESFSVNCNILIALLSSRTPESYAPQIRKALNFLSSRWSKGSWSDKWNLEPEYCMMLYSQALMSTVELWAAECNGHIGQVLEEYVRDHIPVATLQILIRTLSSRKDDGSWKGCPETTAYAVLTLKRLVNLPWCASTSLESHVREAIALGVEFLQRSTITAALIWVEKVTYGSELLAETYCVAALASRHDKPSTQNEALSTKLTELLEDVLPTAKKLNQFVGFFSRLPIFSKEPQWRLHASIIEGFLLAPSNRRTLQELNVFQQEKPQTNGQPKMSYLEYIPLTWTTCNNAANFGISTDILLDMLCISALNFQVDKYLEQVTEHERLLRAGSKGFEAIKDVIRDICQDCQFTNGSSPTGDPASELDGLVRDVRENLSRFVQFSVDHPRVSSGSPAARRRLLRQLSVFLEAHITQGYDNAQLRDQLQRNGSELAHVFTGAQDIGQSYYDWVRTTSADHTSCPYSFELFTLLVSSWMSQDAPGYKENKNLDCLSTSPLTRYLASDVCRHLATLCRQYNDYGSVRRDNAEGNLNSIDFPEFHQEQQQRRENGVAADGTPDAPLLENGKNGFDGSKSSTLEQRRAELMQLADYERQCLDHALGRLKPLVDQRISAALQVFVDVTDLYGQIYVVRDINAN